MTWGKRIARVCVAGVVTLLVGLAFAWAQPPAEEVNLRPSTYAPAKALLYQFHYLVERLRGYMEDESRYDRRVKRVGQESSTLSVLALVLGNHDEQNPLQGRAAGVIDATSKLTASTDDHGKAKAAYAELIAALKSPEKSAKTEWKQVGDIEQLMLQIPELERKLKLVIDPSRIGESAEDGVSLAATLAAVAQVSMFHDDYCQNDQDRADWAELCACLRDAAVDLQAAIRDGDPDAAGEAMLPLQRTCDDCHDQFQD